jgi:hypothetical protein
MFRTEILKTGKNKFEPYDIVVWCGKYYQITHVYNDFTYSMVNIHTLEKRGIVNDSNLTALPLKRFVITEKVKKKKEYMVDPITGEINLKYNPHNVFPEDYYL